MSIDPDKAAVLLGEHFDRLSSSDFVSAAEKYSPELLEGGPAPALPAELPDGGNARPSGSTEPDVQRPLPQQIPLAAYLACGLTGLGEVERQLIFSLSDTVSTVCRGHGIDLYEPRKATDPVFHPDVADTHVFNLDREKVLSRDLLILLAHYPSTGAGQELDFALNGLVPIIVIAHSSTKVSRMITGVPNLYTLITYEEPEELRAELDRHLHKLRPLLVQRRLAYGSDLNLLGARVRELRQRQNLSRSAVVKRLNVPSMTESWLETLESSPDRVSNPALTQIRSLAMALNTTVADLLEPDLADRVLDYLEDWTSDRRAARADGISRRDRNRVVRRVLLRVIDTLEDDD
jgi:transcriptional regulator with XRE-family HTH domain